jgi:hypothetical protein
MRSVLKRLYSVYKSEMKDFNVSQYFKLSATLHKEIDNLYAENDMHFQIYVHLSPEFISFMVYLMTLSVVQTNVRMINES